MAAVTYVSLGENCLIDEILKDFHLRKETYPFGSGRFNIEYIRQICEEDLAHFLDPNFLRYAEVEGIQVVKNDYYTFENDIYESTVCDAVEFTHHNVLDPKVRESVQRKVERFRLALSDPRDYVFMYYYRYSEKRNEEAIITQLKMWMDGVEKKSGVRPRLIFLHQELVNHYQDSHWKYQEQVWGIEVTMYTKQVWEGAQRWSAADDRDLFREMLNHPPLLQFVYGEDWKLEQKRRKRQANQRRWQSIKSRIKSWLQLNKG